MNSLKVTLLPAFKDNYIFMLEDMTSGITAVVDPGDAKVVTAYLEKHKKTLDYIFITHHHWDHTDGNKALKKAYDPVIFGAEKDAHRIPEIDEILKEGDIIPFGTHTFHILETDGHTKGHISYYCENSGKPILFCGDTLFAMGCGRLFEGTAEDLYESFQKIKKLPEETQVYCGHEYTQSNAEFLLSVQPDHQVLQDRMETVKALRATNQPTIPTTLKQELATNLFLTAKTPNELGALRALKDKS